MQTLTQEEVRERLKDCSPTEIMSETGIHRNKISAWRNGLHISHHACVMWTYYFAYQELSEKLSKDGK